MSKTKKILSVCLIIAVLSTIVGVISAIINPESAFFAASVGPAVTSVVLCVALLSSKGG
ncbi:MAG: hypothetical protein FWH20_02875 [Oscillospiraceae bacterium]|nr:hypothetical protein [Oscillospiraceae bacterium]